MLSEQPDVGGKIPLPAPNQIEVKQMSAPGNCLGRLRRAEREVSYHPHRRQTTGNEPARRALGDILGAEGQKGFSINPVENQRNSMARGAAGIRSFTGANAVIPSKSHPRRRFHNSQVTRCQPATPSSNSGPRPPVGCSCCEGSVLRARWCQAARKNDKNVRKVAVFQFLAGR